MSTMDNTGQCHDNPQLEAAYAAAVEAVCKERDTRLNELEQRHTRLVVIGWSLSFIVS